jgi:hypothetical protein
MPRSSYMPNISGHRFQKGMGGPTDADMTGFRCVNKKLDNLINIDRTLTMRNNCRVLNPLFRAL